MKNMTIGRLVPLISIYRFPHIILFPIVPTAILYTFSLSGSRILIFLSEIVGDIAGRYIVVENNCGGEDPELYDRYDKQMKAYNWKLHKSTLEQDSLVDPSYDENKKLIQG